MMPGVPERRTHSYVRHGTTTLFAALDVASGFIIGKCYKRHRAVEFLKKQPCQQRGTSGQYGSPLYAVLAIVRFLSVAKRKKTKL